MASEDTIIGVEIKYGDDGSLTAECRAELVKARAQHRKWITTWHRAALTGNGLKKASEKLDEVHYQMCLIDGELDEDNIPASLEYDKKVIEIKAAIQNQKPCGQNVAATEQLKGPIKASTPTEESTVESVQVHLRLIPLPSFDDKVCDWLSSWATFELVEHNNTRINEVAKLCRSE